METCDVCGNLTTWAEGTAYTADEFRRIVRMGFQPCERVRLMGPAAVDAWKNGLVANSTTGWLLCPMCALPAGLYLSKPPGTGPGGHVLNENMRTEQLMGLDPTSRMLAALMSGAPAPTASRKEEKVEKEAEEEEVSPPPLQAEPVYLGEKTKECPACGKKIKALAETCPACSARFEIYTRAYCTRCHKIIHTTAAGKCPDCAGETLLDPRPYSRMTAAGRPTTSKKKKLAAEVPAPESLSAAPALPAPAASAAVPVPESPAPVQQPVPLAVEAAVPVGDVTPAGDTKKCPVCAETIKAEAKICRFCKAGFQVETRGYCSKCRAVVVLDASDRCSRCGGGVVDRHMESQLIKQPATVDKTSPASAPAAPGSPVHASALVPTVTAAAGMSLGQLYFSPNGRIGRLTYFLKGYLPVMAGIAVCYLIIIMGMNEQSTRGTTGVGTVIGWIGLLMLVYIDLMLVTKRFHDINRSGWMILLWFIPAIGGLINLVNAFECFFTQGTVGPNKYGDRAY